MEPAFNKNAKLLIEYVNATHQNVFLTGKAGTGKTTLLKYISENTHKNTAVAAPTGIAAINAGGSTLHSLLQLPFGTFLPDDQFALTGARDDRINTPQTVKKNLKMRAQKRSLLRELELLIIDEVSMLRADLTDCIDTVLRHVRRRHSEPFGGLQILFIGDLNQLPPVIKRDEQGLFDRFYSGSYFFNSKVIAENPPVYIELEKIYRQSDDNFLSILNRLRNNELTQNDIARLNTHYKPDFNPPEEEGYIHVTTHNRKADAINRKALDHLPGKPRVYEAETSGDFPESMYPIPAETELKTGAKVMFVTNDPTGAKRFFNGKIGMVKDLDENGIDVEFKDSGEVITVEPYEWENIRYKYDDKTDEIHEVVKGTFRHYPLKLAHAVTVHKSQGLTFEKAILDLSGSFAPGQMYVALSRLVSLDGLVLSTPVPDKNLPLEDEIVNFAALKKDYNTLTGLLESDKREYLLRTVERSFDLSDLYFAFINHLKEFSKDESRSKRMTFLSWTQELKNEVGEMRKTADKFIKVARGNTPRDEHFYEYLSERTSKAEEYFGPLLEELHKKLKSQYNRVKAGKQLKTYTKELKELTAVPLKLKKRIAKAALLARKLEEGEIPTGEDLHNLDSVKQLSAEKKNESAEKKKPPKGQTKIISFELFNKGMTPEEIAEGRNLTVSTVMGHLAYFVKTGLLAPEKLLPEEKLNNIMKVIEITGADSLSEIKQKLGDEYTYGEIKIATSHHARLAENE